MIKITSNLANHSRCTMLGFCSVDGIQTQIYRNNFQRIYQE